MLLIASTCSTPYVQMAKVSQSLNENIILTILILWLWNDIHIFYELQNTNYLKINVITLLTY